MHVNEYAISDRNWSLHAVSSLLTSVHPCLTFITDVLTDIVHHRTAVSFLFYSLFFKVMGALTGYNVIQCSET